MRQQSMLYGWLEYLQGLFYSARGWYWSTQVDRCSATWLWNCVAGRTQKRAPPKVGPWRKPRPRVKFLATIRAARTSFFLEKWQISNKHSLWRQIWDAQVPLFKFWQDTWLFCFKNSPRRLDVSAIQVSPGASRGYRAPSGGQFNFGVFLMFMLQIVGKDYSPSKKMGHRYFSGPSKGGMSVLRFCIKI